MRIVASVLALGDPRAQGSGKIGTARGAGSSRPTSARDRRHQSYSPAAPRCTLPATIWPFLLFPGAVISK